VFPAVFEEGQGIRARRLRKSIVLLKRQSRFVVTCGNQADRRALRPLNLILQKPSTDPDATQMAVDTERSDKPASHLHFLQIDDRPQRRAIRLDIP
jgi:hypothetical protein